MNDRLLVLDLFAGTGSSTRAFEERGHRVIKVERDRRHEADCYADVNDLTPEMLLDICGGWPDFIWASPPCTAFSVASIGRHWLNGGENPQARTPAALEAQKTVQHTLDLIDKTAPLFFLIENPRGMLRKLPFMQHLPRWTVTYCQYGEERMKPTDLWGEMPLQWKPRPPCVNGAPCHTAAPRGATTGTQGRKGTVSRSMVPYELSLDICLALEECFYGIPD